MFRPRIYGSVSGFQHSHSASLVYHNIHPLFCISSARTPASHVPYTSNISTYMRIHQSLTTARVCFQVCFCTIVMLQPLWFLLFVGSPHPSYAFSVTYILPLLGVVSRDELVLVTLPFSSDSAKAFVLPLDFRADFFRRCVSRTIYRKWMDIMFGISELLVAKSLKILLHPSRSGTTYSSR